MTFQTSQKVGKGLTIRKVMGGKGNFRAAGIFFRHQIPCMNFFLAHSMKIFLGLIGVMIFFHLIFPIARIIFLYFARAPHPPPPPISFLMVRPIPKPLVF